MGLTEIVLILGIALVLFGPEDLPDIARTIGKIVYEIRKATQDVTKEISSSINEPAGTISKALDLNKPLDLNKALDLNLNKVLDVNKALDLTSKPEAKAVSTSNKSENGKTDEELLTFEDEKPADPLAELPSDMVSYEEKDASR